VKKVKIPLNDEQVKLFHALAQEIVQAYQTKDNILKSLSITENDYELISQNPTFQKILRQLMAEWGVATNTSKRIKLKSQWAIEEGLPYIFQSMTDINEPLSARVEAFKAISKIGQLDAHDAIHGADKSFRLEINIGVGVPTVTIHSEKIIEHDPNESEWEADLEDNYTSGRFVPADPPTFGREEK
jgi:hypothetical protein